MKLPWSFRLRQTWNLLVHGIDPRYDATIQCLQEESIRVEKLETALKRIARWHGEFPPSDRFFDEPKNTQPMSYGMAFGSNGERDFMRQIALNALSKS